MRYLSIILGICLVSWMSCSDSPKKTVKKKKPRTTQIVSPKEVEDKAEIEVEPTEKPVKDPIPKEQLEKANEMIAAITEEEMAKVDAKGKFKMYCARCHGFNGKLKVNGAADLHQSKIPLNERVAQIYFGRKLMTPFKGVLTDVEIVTLAKYIEKLR